MIDEHLKEKIEKHIKDTQKRGKMDLHTARLVREVKKSSTWRRLAEVFYDSEDLFFGDQYAGKGLCDEAMEALGIDRNVHYPTADEQFNEENRSYIGDFFWWE